MLPPSPEGGRDGCFDTRLDASAVVFATATDVYRMLLR